MHTTSRSIATLFLILFSATVISAQEAPNNQRADPLVTATASDTRVRYVSVGEVHQTRLQVFAADGSQVFDSSFRLGNLLDWRLVDQQGQPLAAGNYLYLVTVKDFSERLTQKYGSALLEEGKVLLEQTALDSVPQAQAAALEANKKAELLSAVDRVGAGDVNRTPGTDSAGGAEPSGTAGARGTTPGGESATGEGTQHYLAKWLDNAGGLGNSVIYEDAAGRIGIGTNAPREGLTAFTSAGVAKYIMSEWGSGGTVALGGDNSAGPFLISHTDSLGRATGNYTASRLRFGAQGVGFDISPPTPVGQVRSWTTQALLDPSGRLALSLGSANPTSTLDMAGELNMRGVPAPAVAPAGQGRIFFNSATNTFQVSQNNGAYVNLVGGGGGGSSAIGPPYTWVCTPAHFPSASATIMNADLSIFNASGSTANVNVQFLRKDGTSLTGVAIPGTGGPTYPGNVGAATTAIAPANTLSFTYTTPPGNATPAADIPGSIRVTSNQVIVVGGSFQGSSLFTQTCNQVHP